MAKNNELLTLGVIMLAGILIFRARSQIGRAMTLVQLERSSTALARGIDNTIPLDLRTRAVGLGIVAGELRAAGFRVTSTWRSLALSDAVRAINRDAGVNQSTALPAGTPGDHDRARGIDVAPQTPTRDVTIMRDLADALEASSMASYIDRVVVEDNHVHLRLDADALEDLGARMAVV